MPLPSPCLSVPGGLHTAVLAVRISSQWILACWTLCGCDPLSKTTWLPGFSSLSREVNGSVLLAFQASLGYEKKLLQLAWCLPKRQPSLCLKPRSLVAQAPEEIYWSVGYKDCGKSVVSGPECTVPHGTVPHGFPWLWEGVS